MRTGQQLRWIVRLLLFPNNRIGLHLPLTGWDREGRWRDFPAENTDLPLHWTTIKDIELYLGKRFQGATLEVWQKNSGGMWEGKTEENWVVLIDLDLRLRDIKWLCDQKGKWKDRFEQKSIYVTVHPIWVLESDAESTIEKKRDT